MLTSETDVAALGTNKETSEAEVARSDEGEMELGRGHLQVSNSVRVAGEVSNETGGHSLLLENICYTSAASASSQLKMKCSSGERLNGLLCECTADFFT